MTSLGGQDNPFNLSRMGYANPAANERGLPSAMKARPKIPRTPEGNTLLNSAFKPSQEHHPHHADLAQEQEEEEENEYEEQYEKDDSQEEEEEGKDSTNNQNIDTMNKK